MIIMLTGLSGAGKSTLSKNLQFLLREKGIDTEVIDGDEYRKHVCADLGFSKEDRKENIRRLGYVAAGFSAKGIVAIISAINPYQESRDDILNSYPNSQLVFVDCPVTTLIARDTKGLYKRSVLKDGHPDKVSNLSGINDNYDIPAKPDLYINTCKNNLKECTNRLAKFIIGRLTTCRNHELTAVMEINNIF